MNTQITTVKMAKLERIANLRGKNVVLENISNSKLRKVLENRTIRNRFNDYGNKDHDKYNEYREYSEKYPPVYGDGEFNPFENIHTDKSAGYGEARVDDSEYQEKI